jgi:taurine transport system permease protein
MTLPVKKLFPRSREARDQRTTLVVAALFLCSLILAWICVSHFGLVSPLFLPSPMAVIHQFVAVSRDGFPDVTLASHLLWSLRRVAIALVVACLFAIPTGFAIALSPIARGIFDPIIQFYRPIPPLAYLPLIIIWFGIDEAAKIILIYLAIFWIVEVATAAGVKGVPIERINAAKSMGATRWQVLWFVILPSALPNILVGIRIGLANGWSALVAAELIAATRGLGFMIETASQYLATDIVMMGIGVIGLVAFAMELMLRGLERVLVPWYGRV